MKAIIKTIWKNTGIKVWAIISVILLTLVITTTIVLCATPFLYGTINSVLGGERRVLVEGDPSKYIYYKADYTEKSEALAAANRLNERINEEGIVLLKNEDGALPLADDCRVTVFGKNSVDIVLGGSGSNAGILGSGVVDLYSGLANAGITYNPTMKSFYDGSQSGTIRAGTPGMGDILTGYPIGETPASAYGSVRSSYALYSDAAIVVLSRIGGEGYDLPRTMFWDESRYTNWSGTQKIPGARSADDHYLQLDQNETDMLKEACDNFQKVVVVINSASTLELGFLDDPAHYAYNQKIKAALWIGNPGKTGLNALGRILCGDVNPSGKTADTYARNFDRDPTWNNFGNNREDGSNRYSLGGNKRNAYFVDYEEGIYVGYRYYETRGYTERLKVLTQNPAATEEQQNAWYKSNVVYPFGYGLSYTQFSLSVVEQHPGEGAVLEADDTVTLTVKVQNEGSRAGKEVVQLYYTPQYKGAGGIEKAHVVLGDFAKTVELAPKGEEGDSETVTLKLKVQDMASYDYNNANNNDFYGYELEAGTYELKIMRDAHTPVETYTYTVANDIKYKNDTATNTKIENLFGDVSNHIGKYLSRSDWEGTWPQPPSDTDRAVDESFINSLTYSLSDTAADPWYSSDAPEQSKNVLHYNNTEVKLYDLIDKEYDDEDGLWEKLLDQLTVGQMEMLITRGNYRTMNLNNIDKPLTIDADGPMGFAVFMGDPSVYDTCYYASECVLASTWNEKLAYEMGVAVGNESLIGDKKGDGRTYSGWYAPAVNIHRSSFGGRNFEYYSEDGRLSGRMAVGVIGGAMSKGVYTYVKHFALNDQETNRDTTGLIVWANEQAMRELYFLPFEMAVKDGGTTAIMSSFNRIGAVWAGGNHKLLTELLRNEWGFCGMVITDYNLKPYMNVDQMIRAGGDLNLSPDGSLSLTNTPTTLTAMRRAVKNILYTVANSNAMNGMGEGVIYRYDLPYWVICLIVADASLFLFCAVVGAVLVIRIVKKNKTKNR